MKGLTTVIISNEHVKNGLAWAGKRLHAPEQRIVLGATALATQPFIDLHNKDVDEETRKLSAARTVAKIIAGTAVGVAVRYAGIWFVNKYSQFEKVYADAQKTIVKEIIPDAKKGFLTPLFLQKSIFPISDKELMKRMTKYRKAMGTLVATIAMVATNFLLDAPLTKYLTNVFQKHINTPSKTQEKEVNQ